MDTLKRIQRIEYSCGNHAFVSKAKHWINRTRGGTVTTLLSDRQHGRVLFLHACIDTMNSENLDDIGLNPIIVEDLSIRKHSIIQMQSASLKGWKDLSTMWGGTATTLETAEGAPSEGTSLLGGGQAANAKNKKGYSESNRKPLLESSPEKEGDDWGAGWGDDWGEDSASSKSSHSKASPTELGNDKWDSWSNEKSAPAAEKAGQEAEDDWNKEWESFDRPTTKTAKSKVNQKKAAQRAARTAAPDSGAKAKEAEPATANLIDLGGLGGEDGGPRAGAEPGWDNDTWGAEDAEWQSLDVSSNNQKNVIKRD